MKVEGVGFSGPCDFKADVIYSDIEVQEKLKPIMARSIICLFQNIIWGQKFL